MLDLSAIPLVDQHCHGVVAGPVDGPGFERMLTESRQPLRHGTSWFDTQLGLAVRALCPPLLGLAPHSLPGEYLARRAELSTDELNQHLLRSTGISDYLVDTGLDGSLLRPPDIAAASGSRAYELVRLESVAERVLRSGTSATGFATAFADALAAATTTAVALKSVAAYRYGLDLDPARPSTRQVRGAAGRWLAEIEATGNVRLTDPVLLRHLLWTGVDTGLPLQFHTGFGDADLTLHRSDPALLTPFLRATQSASVAVILLHCYPYHRNAAYLAHVFPHVYVDVGLTLNYVGARAGAVLAETLELAPFSKVLFSTDAYGLPELYVVGAALFRRHLQRLLTEWVDEDAWAPADAERIAGMIAHGNARALYRLR
jgi:predicted TIM-barrel fold metal-dependent hydrolase